MRKTAQNDPSLAGIHEIYQFEAWYYQQLAYFACDAGGIYTPQVERLRNESRRVFSDMLVRLLELNWSQLYTLHSVLSGFKELYELVDKNEIPERRVLLHRLLRDPVKRLERFGILDSSGE
ncbi:MAG TPA: hypothetical protein VH593_29465 [Ktedonobacteraceae bacterium]|jgi:hypothetical protein